MCTVTFLNLQKQIKSDRHFIIEELAYLYEFVHSFASKNIT